MKKNKDYLDLIIGDDSPLNGLVDKHKILQMYEIDSKKDNQYLTCLINLAIWMKNLDLNGKRKYLLPDALIYCTFLLMNSKDKNLDHA